LPGRQFAASRVKNLGQCEWPRHAPAGLTATAASSSQIDLSWSASTDDVAVTGYRLYRDGTLLAVIGTTSERTYDRVGNVLTETQKLSSGADPSQQGTQTYSYDALGRVLGSSISSGQTYAVSKAYTYDADGNRLTVKVNNVVTDTFTFDATDQTISDNAHTFAYDRYGNLTSSRVGTAAVTTYGYDLADRLNSITAPDGSVVGFTFDAAGRHATRTSGTGTNQKTIDDYAYVGTTNSVVQDVSTAGTSITINAVIDSSGNRLASSAGSSFAWIVPDLHGNIAAQCSATGSTIDVFRYDAYGVSLGSPLAASSVPSPWRFQGRMLESTSGSAIYDFTARAYVPDLGTFTSLDSVSGSAGNPITLNRYLYAGANPATLVDPSGHCFGPCFDPGAFVSSLVSTATQVYNTATTTAVSTVANVYVTAGSAAGQAYSTATSTADSAFANAQTTLSEAYRTVAKAYDTASSLAVSSLAVASAVARSTVAQAHTVAANVVGFGATVGHLAQSGLSPSLSAISRIPGGAVDDARWIAAKGQDAVTWAENTTGIHTVGWCVGLFGFLSPPPGGPGIGAGASLCVAISGKGQVALLPSGGFGGGLGPTVGAGDYYGLGGGPLISTGQDVWDQNGPFNAYGWGAGDGASINETLEEGNGHCNQDVKTVVINGGAGTGISLWTGRSVTPKVIQIWGPPKSDC
jgi:RHS repeat-associated protein